MADEDTVLDGLRDVAQTLQFGAMDDSDIIAAIDEIVFLRCEIVRLYRKLEAADERARKKYAPCD